LNRVLQMDQMAVEGDSKMCYVENPALQNAETLIQGMASSPELSDVVT